MTGLPASRSASGARGGCWRWRGCCRWPSGSTSTCLGTGFPSFWVARMGEMRLTLGLSGWTTNDWTRGSALDLLAPPAKPSRELIARRGRMAARMRGRHRWIRSRPAWSPIRPHVPRP